MKEQKQKERRGRAFLWLNLAAAVGVAVLTTLLLCFTPLRTLMPGYLTPQSREQVINFALRVDSLEEAVARQNMYVTNLQDILRGRVHIDSVVSIDTLTALRAADLMEQTEREKAFARQYEETERYNLTTQASRVSGVQGLNLNVPVRGVVQHTFDPMASHYGIDIVSTPDAALLAVLDGTVLVSAFSPATGQTIVLQHNSDLVSVYAQCGSLLHKTGDKVKAGEALATAVPLVEGEQTPIHFELWHKGIPLDPTVYIAF